MPTSFSTGGRIGHGLLIIYEKIDTGLAHCFYPTPLQITLSRKFWQIIIIPGQYFVELVFIVWTSLLALGSLFTFP
jgi:hypothetical protein